MAKDTTTGSNVRMASQDESSSSDQSKIVYFSYVQPKCLNRPKIMSLSY